MFKTVHNRLNYNIRENDEPHYVTLNVKRYLMIHVYLDAYYNFLTKRPPVDMVRRLPVSDTKFPKNKKFKSNIKDTVENGCAIVVDELYISTYIVIFSTYGCCVS